MTISSSYNGERCESHRGLRPPERFVYENSYGGGGRASHRQYGYQNYGQRPIAGVQAFVLSMSPGIDTTLLIREFQNVGQLRSYLRRHSGDPMAAAAKLRDKIRFSAELAGRPYSTSINMAGSERLSTTYNIPLSRDAMGSTMIKRAACHQL
jgi:hypothetical protein